MPHISEAAKLHFKRGFQGVVLFFFADFGAQIFARYKRLMIVDAKADDFSGPSSQGHKAKVQLRANWDFYQCARSGFFGGFVYVPLRLQWHNSLDRLFPLHDGLTPALRQGAIVRRFGSEHALFTPVLLAFYFAWHSVMEGRVAEAPRRAMSGAVPATLISWAMWLPTQAFCLYFIPAWGWNAVTAWVTLAWAFVVCDTNRRLKLELDERVALEAERAAARMRRSS